MDDKESTSVQIEPELYSHSRIDDFMDCPEKYRKRHIQRLYPKKRSAPLALGGCMAAGLAAFRASKDISDLDGRIDMAHKGFIKKWMKEGKVLALKKDDDPKRSVHRGLEILTEYCQTYPNDPEETVQPEIWFDEEIAPGIRYRGRIDAVMRTSDFVITEDKTTSWLTTTYMRQQRSSYQVLWYLWIAKKLGLFDICGKRPKLMLNIIKIDPAKTDFQRQIVPKTFKEIDQSFPRLLDWIKTIQMHKKANIWPMANSKVCLKFGGCEYLPLRDASPTIRAALLEHEYEYREPTDISELRN